MFAKIEITGEIKVVSGLHIGASDAFAAIGAIDSPVVRDAYSDLPMIPGSSLKGKIRSLLAKAYPNDFEKTADDDSDNILRLFGCAKKDKLKNSRLIFSDMVMDNWTELKKLGLQGQTEAKFENTISRMTSEANPRQIERVVRGATFPLQLIYNVENEDEIIEDIALLKEGMTLLSYDYLGGSGSRGYGKVKFSGVAADVVVGDVADEIIDKCNEILAE
ncbi:type III-A CRISPR-associated RAMP protein Csm3 [Butyribacter intestini]|uniref:CRISPR system Cms endoribonuclease Csm3 n=1 Tax=Butyribacter intestini TaxID=1703332 RepID=A0AAW3JPG2_9FIRM|nr:type III-A CRISPR-associated RAMP protein Csm3 [Butyribacter intestini]RHU73887.1 type III-A CRISPR-associated RAMP protein Csm3 [Butyribacter intestini]